jgi:hypothetical protein
MRNEIFYFYIPLTIIKSTCRMKYIPFDVDIYVFITIIGSIPLLVDYYTPGYHTPSSQSFYHWGDTSAGGLLVPEVSYTL